MEVRDGQGRTAVLIDNETRLAFQAARAFKNLALLDMRFQAAANYHQQRIAVLRGEY